jgi:hypothetical protein
VYAPFLESTILSNLFGIVVNYVKYNKFRTLISELGKLITKTNLKIRSKQMNPVIGSVLSGINLRLAGRFLSHRFTQRVRNKEIQRGGLNRTSAQYVKLSRVSNKNRRGAYCITITTGYSILD